MTLISFTRRRKK